MILDSRNEVESAARAAGVTVKDCRTPEEKAQPLDVNNLAAPAWARWIAADYDGKVWAYENCPAFSGDGMWHIHGWKSHLDTIDMIGIDWRRTLTPVNVEQPTQLWCEQCNLPDDICRGHDADDLATALLALDAVTNPRYVGDAQLTAAAAQVIDAASAITVPLAQVSIGVDAIPSAVATALMAQHGAF